MKISAIKTHLFELPALQPRSDAIQSFTVMELVIVELCTSTDVTGVGYSYTIGTGGRAVKAFLDNELKPLLKGEDCECHQRIWDKMYHRTRASNGGPIDSIARAAVDVAVWDLKAKSAGVPLFKLLGGSQERVPVYDTEGGWLHFSIDELVANARTSIERGFQGIKLKVGKSSSAEDVCRVAAVRSAVGPAVKLMVDANQAWTAAEAIRRVRAFEPFDLFWLEEPIPAGDIGGHQELRRHTSVPIAVGETIYSKEVFAEYLRREAASILQPDVGRIGGITEWMKIANMAESFQVAVAPHFLMELHIHLTAAVPNGMFVEYIPQLSQVLKSELELLDGTFLPPNEPGHGVCFDWDKLETYRAQ